MILIAIVPSCAVGAACSIRAFAPGIFLGDVTRFHTDSWHHYPVSALHLSSFVIEKGAHAGHAGGIRPNAVRGSKRQSRCLVEQGARAGRTGWLQAAFVIAPGIVDGIAHGTAVDRLLLIGQ
jgi:hypothetical protein